MYSLFPSLVFPLSSCFFLVLLCQFFKTSGSQYRNNPPRRSTRRSRQPGTVINFTTYLTCRSTFFIHVEISDLELSHDDQHQKGTQLLTTKQRKQEGTCSNVKLIVTNLITYVGRVQPPCDVLLQENNSHQNDLPFKKKGKQGDCDNIIMQIYPLLCKPISCDTIIIIINVTVHADHN